jgi:hypothetical protein
MWCGFWVDDVVPNSVSLQQTFSACSNAASAPVLPSVPGCPSLISAHAQNVVGLFRQLSQVIAAMRLTAMGDFPVCAASMSCRRLPPGDDHFEVAIFVRGFANNNLATSAEGCPIAGRAFRALPPDSMLLKPPRRRRVVSRPSSVDGCAMLWRQRRRSPFPPAENLEIELQRDASCRNIG